MLIKTRKIANIFNQLLFIVIISNINANSALAFNITLESINFDGFTGSGFSATPGSGQLDSDDWAVSGFGDGNVPFGGSGTTGDFARGTSSGGEGTGGIYSFDVGTSNPALGVQPTGTDFTPGSFTLRLNNDTGAIIEDLEISYDLFILNDQPRSNSFNFSYSDDNVDYENVTELNFTSTESSDSLGWVENQRSTTLSGVSIATGDDFYLRWSGADVSGDDRRDEFALDDISFRAVPFEFSPSLGLLIMGGLGLISQLKKRHKLTQESPKR